MPPIAAENSASPYDPVKDVLQRLILVDRKFERKAVASHPALGVSEDTVSRWVNGQSPPPARALPGLYFALSRYIGVFSCLLQETNLIVIPRPQLVVRRAPGRIMEELLIRFGEVYRIFGKVLRDQPLTAEELLEMEEEVQKAKATLDEALEVTRQRRKEQRARKKYGNG
ncbi:MAG TPA: hypothetical protein VKK81_27745 [Candidatus Binatia bacterium]|nr:hypothetical protein [Candidatus Binatia bacterium]